MVKNGVILLADLLLHRHVLLSLLLLAYRVRLVVILLVIEASTRNAAARIGAAYRGIFVPHVIAGFLHPRCIEALGDNLLRPDEGPGHDIDFDDARRSISLRLACVLLPAPG